MSAAPLPSWVRGCEARRATRLSDGAGVSKQELIRQRAYWEVNLTPSSDPLLGAPPFDDLGPTPQARVRHRRDHLHPLRRRGADRGQHRIAQVDPRHPGPLRNALCAGACALPARPARAADCGGVTPRRAGYPRRNAEEDTVRRRRLRIAFAPLPRMAANRRENARRGDPAGHEARLQRLVPRRTRRLRDLRLPGRVAEKGA